MYIELVRIATAALLTVLILLSDVTWVICVVMALMLSTIVLLRACGISALLGTHVWLVNVLWNIRNLVPAVSLLIIELGNASRVSDGLMVTTVLMIVRVRPWLRMTWPHSVLRGPMHEIPALMSVVSFLRVVTRHTMLVARLVGRLLMNWWLNLLRLRQVMRVLMYMLPVVVLDSACSTFVGLFVRNL